MRRGFGKMFNAGNGGRYTLNEIWAMLEKMERVEIGLKYGPPGRAMFAIPWRYHGCGEGIGACAEVYD